MLLEERIARGASALLIVVAAVACAAPAFAAEPAAYVLDATTGRALYAQHGESRRYPASLTKMMTLYLLFGDLERKRVSLDTRFRVSKHAAAQAPVKLWLKPGDTISAGDAIRALVTISANDVAATIAENLAGSEVAFARRMTRTARQLGMRHTQFRNASGLPAKGQVTTAHDMALLGAALQARFPAYYRYFKTTRFAYRGRVYRGHNHLLSRFKHVDGIKTGFTRASGFNIVTSFRRHGRKMIVVVMGGPTYRARDARAAGLIKRYAGRLRRDKGYFASLMTGVRRADAHPAKPKPQTVQVAAAGAFSVRVADVVSIRVGALPTRDAAEALIAATKPVVSRLLDGAEAQTKRVERDGKTYFRAAYAGFDDVDAANKACALLKRHDFSCYAAVRPAAATAAN